MSRYTICRPSIHSPKTSGCIRFVDFELITVPSVMEWPLRVRHLGRNVFLHYAWHAIVSHTLVHMAATALNLLNVNICQDSIRFRSSETPHAGTSAGADPFDALGIGRGLGSYLSLYIYHVKFKVLMKRNTKHCWSGLFVYTEFGAVSYGLMYKRSSVESDLSEVLLNILVITDLFFSFFVTYLKNVRRKVVAVFFVFQIKCSFHKVYFVTYRCFILYMAKIKSFKLVRCRVKSSSPWMHLSDIT